jgi:hypothetical protein
MRYGAVTDEMINNPSMVLGVLTPDVLYSDDLDAAKYDSLDENAISYRCQRKTSGVF